VQKTARRLINRYPSYIFINMRYSPDLWYLVRNTPGVLGVIGSSGKGKAPIPISQEQYEQLTNQKASAPTPVVQSSVNGEIELLEKNHVKILRGQFVDAKGVVKAVDKANKIAKVAIDAFGRDQIIDVDFNDLEKI
jgi:transcriptional antiterminator NusG